MHRLPAIRAACVVLALLTACSGSTQDADSGVPPLGTAGVAAGAGNAGASGSGAGSAAISGDASLADATQQTGSPDGGDAATSTGPGDATIIEPQPSFVAGVDVHGYPKPTAYGYTQADGGDRMANALTALGATHVRGPAIGEVALLSRLASAGVHSVILGLDAKAYGKPFDASKLEAALDASLTAANGVGLTLQVEGLNEWDLFNTKAYNDGVIPAGKSVSDFISITQKALYEAAHARGIQVLGPSVGHPSEQSSLDMFPDVSAYVDIVNMHLYYGTKPDTLPIADHVSQHQKFQGAGKPVWITETGVSAYGGVGADQQAGIIALGLATLEASGLIAAAFNYELLDNQKPGLVNGTFVPESGEYHFGLFTYEGTPKPAAAVVRDFIAAH